MRRMRIIVVAVAAALLLVLSPAGTDLLRAQAGPQVVITMAVAGTVQDRGGAYYIAFTVSDALLAGPQPDSTNWTHYVVYRDGRFSFGTVPPATAQPFGFVAIRPPAPFLFGQVLPDRKALRVTVPLTDLRIGASLPGRFMVNFVTTDENNRVLDALGLGPEDRFGFVTVTIGRDIYLRVPPPRGPRPNPNFALAGGEIQLATP